MFPWIVSGNIVFFFWWGEGGGEENRSFLLLSNDRLGRSELGREHIKFINSRAKHEIL